MHRISHWLCALVVAAPSVALAHGRPPAVYDIAIRPSGPAFATTYGLVVSTSDGFRWACPTAQGRTSSEDPNFLFLGDSFLVGTYRGAMRVDENGCGAGIVQPSLERVVIDFAHQGETTWLVTSDGGDEPNGVFRSDDNAMSFDPVQPDIEPILFERIRIAPSDPSRIYLSGAHPRTAERTERELVVHRSSDAGVTWERFVFEQGVGERAIFLLEVDPVDPDTIYARISREFGEPTVPERLVVSRDGGETWETLVELDGELGGFALDGSTRWVGAPLTGAFERDGATVMPAMGLWKSEEGGPFEHVRDDLSVGCVVPHEGELWVCSNSLSGAFDVGRSADDGATFEAVFSLADLVGPTECGDEQSMLCAPEDRDLVRDYSLDVCLNPPCAVEEPAGGCAAAPRIGESSRTGIFWAVVLGLMWVRRRF